MTMAGTIATRPVRLARRFAVVGLSVAAAVATLATAGSAGPAAGGVDQAGAVDAGVRAYQASYPQMSAAAARTAFEQQRTRKSLYDNLSGDSASFGGVWFDPPTGVVHVAVTTAAAHAKASNLGRDLGLRTQVHLVSRSYAQLEAQAAALRTGTDALSRAAHGQVGIDVQNNRVVAAVAKTALPSLTGPAAAGKAAVPAGVTVVADPGLRTQQDAFSCTDRTTCDFTIHAGNVLWLGSAGNNLCSVGFTARNSANQRYVYTAGHCNIGSGTWGTGARPIGPIVSSVQSGSIDASIIRVDNSWFASDHGGEIFPSFDVNYVAPSLPYIFVGDVVCLAANFPAPATGFNSCGTVGSVSDPSVLGMVRVDGLDGCPGDSGGGWYWLASSTFRVAYGMHSRSDIGCHGDSGGSHSWFSPLPTVAPLWGLTVEVA